MVLKHLVPANKWPSTNSVPVFLDLHSVPLDKRNIPWTICLGEQIGWGPFVHGDQIFGDPLSIGTELVGDCLSRGTNQLGTRCHDLSLQMTILGSMLMPKNKWGQIPTVPICSTRPVSSTIHNIIWMSAKCQSSRSRSI